MPWGDESAWHTPSALIPPQYVVFRYKDLAGAVAGHPGREARERIADGKWQEYRSEIGSPSALGVPVWSMASALRGVKESIDG